MRNLHEFNCQAFEGLMSSPEVLQAIEAVTGSRFQTGYIDTAWEWVETDGGGFNDSVRKSRCPAYYEWVNGYSTSEVIEWLLQNGTETNNDRMLLNSDGDVLLWSNTVLIVKQDETLVKICEALGWQYRPQEAVLAEIK